MDHIDSAHDDLNGKISSLERRTRSQLFNLTQTMKEKLAGEKSDCLERVERRTLKERLELEKQQEIAADYIKTELKSWVQSKIDHLRRGTFMPKFNTSKLRQSMIKVEDAQPKKINLTRSKSEEFLSDVKAGETTCATITQEQDYSNLGAKPKHLYEFRDNNSSRGKAIPNAVDNISKMSKSDGDLTIQVSPNSLSKASSSHDVQNLCNDISPNAIHSESSYSSRIMQNYSVNSTPAMSNQPDILRTRPMISHNTVGLPNGDINYRNLGDIPEPEFRITRQFFDTVSNQMEKWYERRLTSMEKKAEERTEHDKVAMSDRINAIEKQLTNLRPSNGSVDIEQETPASLV